MANHSGVLLSSLVEHLHLEIAYKSKDYDSVRLTVEDLSRPGLQLVGYLEHFEPLRLQVMGNAEFSYLSGLSAQERLASYDRIFAYKFPALLIARNLPVDEQCLQMAVKSDRISFGRGNEVIYGKKCRHHLQRYPLPHHS